MNFCVANLSRSPSNLYWDDPSGAEYYLMIQESINKNASSKNYYSKLFLFNKSNIQIIILDQTRTSWISGARHKLFKPSQVSGHVLQAIPTSSISLAKNPNPWIWIKSTAPKNGRFLAHAGSLFGMIGSQIWPQPRVSLLPDPQNPERLVWENPDPQIDAGWRQFQGLAGGGCNLQQQILTYQGDDL